MKKKLLLAIALSCGLYLQAQTTPLWGKQDVYLASQSEKTFQLVNEILSLKENQPSAKSPTLARKSALFLLDGVLHDTRLDGIPAITKFIEGRYEKMLEDMKMPVKKGLKIYKLYNDGFVVKSKSVTVAYDLYRGVAMKETPTLVSDEVMRKIVDLCDIMFLSHNHGDHVDQAVVQMFTDSGKPVVAPTNVLKDNEKVTHVREEQIVNKNYMANGSELRVTILPGHQDKMMNNIYVVTTPEGYTFAQTGDQWNKEDFLWLKGVRSQIPSMDVMLINCWAYNLPETIDGFSPKMVITGHENELGHTIDHREAYWLSYDKLAKVRQSNCLMTWGECYWYR